MKGIRDVLDDREHKYDSLMCKMNMQGVGVDEGKTKWRDNAKIMKCFDTLNVN